MSITHIKTNKKIEVLLRLLKNNESLEDASSKAGLNIEETKYKLAEWLKPENAHYFYSYEWAYKNIKPKHKNTFILR